MPNDQTRYTTRVPTKLRDAFLKVAEANDRSGAQLVRDFMRRYVKNNADALQQSFFEEVLDDAE
jgi:hypothetical protein